MPKPSKAKLYKREEQAAEYKWELLRRNKDYMREAQEVYKILEEGITKHEIFLKYNELLRKVSEHWGISNVIRPTRNFDTMVTKEKLCLFKGSINMDQSLLSFITLKKFYKSDDKWPPFKVEINLDMPKEKIMYDLGKWIDVAQQIKKEKKLGSTPNILKIGEIGDTSM